MSEKRRLRRNNLIYYLKVFDQSNEALLGHLVDITSEGIMLVSEGPIATGIDYRLRLVFPRDIFGEEKIDFTAKSVWSKQDSNPDFYDTGFLLIDMPLEKVLLIKKLVSEYGFES